MSIAEWWIGDVKAGDKGSKKMMKFCRRDSCSVSGANDEARHHWPGCLRVGPCESFGVRVGPPTLPRQASQHMASKDLRPGIQPKLCAQQVHTTNKQTTRYRMHRAITLKLQCDGSYNGQRPPNASSLHNVVFVGCKGSASKWTVREHL